MKKNKAFIMKFLLLSTYFCLAFALMSHKSTALHNVPSKKNLFIAVGTNKPCIRSACFLEKVLIPCTDLLLLH